MTYTFFAAGIHVILIRIPVTNGLSHPYHLDESTNFHFKGHQE